MKQSTPLLLLGALALVCGAAITTRAQEGLEPLPMRETRDARGTETNPTHHEAEVDTKSFKPAGANLREGMVRESSPRDSVYHTAPVVPRKAEKQKTDDVLQFNFLYYIIQRFKFSDIIE
ncbi:MAG: hypothetical protein KatS3mg032_2010 [Cyclobacteriaceae bacterium]|nr:MAG: hypothetical protein KatS3mg032_2010 [Cyclobacteriaceae bacterium]